MKKTKEPALSYHDYLVNYLRGDEKAQDAYLKASFEENSDMPEAILCAIRTVAEARGFSDFAKTAGLNRETLYRTLSEKGNPRYDTFFKLLDALNLRLRVVSK